MNPSERLALMHSIALQRVCEMYGISPVPTVEELERLGDVGVEGENGKIYASLWSVLEKDPEFEKVEEAITALAEAVERAYFYAEDHGEKPHLDFKTESIIDIRMDLTDDASYRVRIYSPTTPKRLINTQERDANTELKDIIEQGYKDELAAPELSTPQTGDGYLICIQKESTPGEDIDTHDETKTFLVVRPGEGNTNMDINELQKLITTVVEGLETDERAQAKITSVKCKFRTAAEITLEPKEGDSKAERYCYLAIDHNLLTIEGEDIEKQLKEGDHKISLVKLFRAIQLRQIQIEDGKIVEESTKTEIEIDKKSKFVQAQGASKVMKRIYPTGETTTEEDAIDNTN